jgi:hypothetical protein
MKKLTILFVITILIAFRGISQTSNDSVTCIPNSQLKLAIVKIEQGKLVKQELDLTNEKVNLLEGRLVLKDSVITFLKEKDALNNKMMWSYEATIANYKTIVDNLDQKYKLQRSISRRQKLAKWGTFIAGLGGGFLIFR